jgi:hypothetical protein
MRQGGFNNNQVAPPSLSNDWGFAQSGAAPSQNGYAADSSTSNYRGSNNNWGDVPPTTGSPPNNGSWPSNNGQQQVDRMSLVDQMPYNGPWPPNSGQGTPNSLPRNNGSVNNAPSNVPPPWNRGNNAPQPRTIGPGPTNSSSANIPEQWPYSKGQ